MIIALAFVLTTQIAPPFPFPLRVNVKPGDSFVGKQTRSFIDPEQDLNLVQVDAVFSKIKSVDSSTGRSEWDHLVRPQKETLDGETRIFDPKAPAMAITEWRGNTGAQFKFETALDEMNELMILSRFVTVPLPAKAPAVDETWEFKDTRGVSYVFRGRYLGFENGAHKVKTYFQSLETPNYTANGVAWIGAHGLPLRVELTAKPIQIPGGDPNRVTCKIVFELNSGR